GVADGDHRRIGHLVAVAGHEGLHHGLVDLQRGVHGDQRGGVLGRADDLERTGDPGELPVDGGAGGRFVDRAGQGRGHGSRRVVRGGRGSGGGRRRGGTGVVGGRATGQQQGAGGHGGEE